MSKKTVNVEYSGVVLEMARSGGGWKKYIETSPPHMNVKLATELIHRLGAYEAILAEAIEE